MPAAGSCAHAPCAPLPTRYKKFAKYIPEGAKEILSVCEGPFGAKTKPCEGKAYYTTREVR